MWRSVFSIGATHIFAIQNALPQNNLRVAQLLEEANQHLRNGGEIQRNEGSSIQSTVRPATAMLLQSSSSGVLNLHPFF